MTGARTEKGSAGQRKSARLRVAILSAIRHGSYMGPAIAAHPDVEVVAVADEPGLPEKWRARGPDLARQLGCPFTEDVDGLLARDDVDSVMVTAEYVRHGRLAVRTLEAGKHLLVDKPMATSLAECRAIVRAADAAARRGVCALAVSSYLAPHVQRARRAVRAGRIGVVRAVHAECVASYGPGEAFDPVADELSWHPRWTGGGEIVNFGLYPLSIIRDVTRLDFESVQCVGGALFNRAHREVGVDDFAIMLVRFRGGATGHVTVGRCHTPRHAGAGLYDEFVEVRGTRGQVRADGDSPSIWIYGVPAVGVARRHADRDWIADLMDRFVRFARDGADPQLDIRDALHVMEAVFAAEESLRSGRVVRIGET